MRRRSQPRLALAIPALAALACTPASDDSADSLALSSPAAPAVQCWVSPQSVLGREAATPAGLTSSQTVPPDTLRGWLRIERSADRERGPAWLVDSDGASLRGTWRRTRADSLVVSGFDDFLQIEFRLAEAGDSLRGRAIATSDAALDRASNGGLVEYRREWSSSHVRASCDTMPEDARERENG